MAKRKRKTTDLVGSFEVDIQPWNGIITSQDPYTIPEDTSVWCSALPKLTGAVENIPDIASVYTHSANILDFFTFYLGSSQYFCILDGSYLRLYSSSFSQIATFATTVSKCDYAIQDNKYIWITAKNSFLIVFDGTSIYDLTFNGITGDAISYWKGRIFVGKDRVFAFSIPNPDPTGKSGPYGSEKVTNGNFSASTGWIFGTGWSYDSTNLEADKASATGSGALEQNIGAVAGEMYSLTFTVKNYSAGGVTPYIGGKAGTTVSANGTYTQIISAIDTSNLKFVPTSDNTVLTIDDVSVKRTAQVFDTSQGGGAITLTVSIFAQILALVPKEDSIYVFTDRSIIALIGTTISNDPTQWYITEIVKDVGITGIRKYVVNEHTVYFHTPFGLYEITATSPQKIDDAITDKTGSIFGICYFSYKQIPYIAITATSAIDATKKAIYCYNLLTKRWFALNIEGTIMSNLLADAWIVNGTKVYKLFGSSNYLPLQVKSKIFFNVDNTYYNIKDVVIYGRGSFNYLQQFITLVFGAQQDNIIFQTSSGQLIQITKSEDFWNAVLKPANTLPYAMRVKQFQIELKQADNAYSEIINVRIRGSKGARYV